MIVYDLCGDCGRYMKFAPFAAFWAFLTCHWHYRHMLLLLVTLYVWKIKVLKTIFIWERKLGCGGGCAAPVKLRSPTHLMRMSPLKAQRIILTVCSYDSLLFAVFNMKYVVFFAHVCVWFLGNFSTLLLRVTLSPIFFLLMD